MGSLIPVSAKHVVAFVAMSVALAKDDHKRCGSHVQ